jgi:hypothetical protein
MFLRNYYEFIPRDTALLILTAVRRRDAYGITRARRDSVNEWLFVDTVLAGRISLVATL